MGLGERDLGNLCCSWVHDWPYWLECVGGGWLWEVDVTKPCDVFGARPERQSASLSPSYLIISLCLGVWLTRLHSSRNWLVCIELVLFFFFLNNIKNLFYPQTMSPVHLNSLIWFIWLLSRHIISNWVHHSISKDPVTVSPVEYFKYHYLISYIILYYKEIYLQTCWHFFYWFAYKCLTSPVQLVLRVTFVRHVWNKHGSTVAVVGQWRHVAIDTQSKQRLSGWLRLRYRPVEVSGVPWAPSQRMLPATNMSWLNSGRAPTVRIRHQGGRGSVIPEIMTISN